MSAPSISSPPGLEADGHVPSPRPQPRSRPLDGRQGDGAPERLCSSPSAQGHQCRPDLRTGGQSSMGWAQNLPATLSHPLHPTSSLPLWGPKGEDTQAIKGEKE